MDTPTLEQRRKVAYRRDMIPALVGYLALLAVAIAVVGDEVEGPVEWFLMLLPVVPAAWGVLAMIRHLRRVDEYQRLLQLEAMAAGFGVSMIAAITVGFVGIGGAATEAAGWIVYGAGTATWGIVASVQGHRACRA
jgi:hypothetical protein